MSTSNQIVRRYCLAGVCLLGAVSLYMVPPAQAAAAPDADSSLYLPKSNAALDLTEFYARNLGFALPGDHAPQILPSVAAQAQAAPSAGSGATAQLLAMADEVDGRELGNMRGGFALPSGLDVSFGFEIATSVGGTVVQQLSVPTTSLTTGVNQSVPMSVTSADGNVSLSLPVGAGGSVSVTSLTNNGLTAVTTGLGAGGITSLLQNRANNQIVQQISTFNLSVGGLNQMLARAAVQNIVGTALSGANMLRR